MNVLEFPPFPDYMGTPWTLQTPHHIVPSYHMDLFKLVHLETPSPWTKSPDWKLLPSIDLQTFPELWLFLHFCKHRDLVTVTSHSMMRQVPLYPSTFVSGEQRCSLEVRIVNLYCPVAPAIYPDYVDYCDCMDNWTISCIVIAIVGPNTSVKLILEIWNYTELNYWWLVSPYLLDLIGGVYKILGKRSGCFMISFSVMSFHVSAWEHKTSRRHL